METLLLVDGNVIMADHSTIPDAPTAQDHECMDHGQEAQLAETYAEKFKLDAIPVFHVIAKDMLEPLIPLMPEQSAQYVQEHSLLLLLALTALIFLVSIAVLKVLLQSFKLKTVVLYGPMEAGKTTLLHTLEGSAPPHGTVSSMKTNEVVVKLPGTAKKVRLVDVPGHPRLRSVYEQHASSASCIVFVLDSASFVADKQTVAEQLYHVLQLQADSGRRHCQVVVACNKADLEERAFSQDFIVRQLEKEMYPARCGGFAPFICQEWDAQPRIIPRAFAEATLSKNASLAV